MNLYREEIKSLVKIILDENSLYSEIKESLNNLYLLFHNLTGISGKPEEINNKFGSLLPHGIAINPQLAAGCIFDYIRTTKFIRGINKALDIFYKKPAEKINILYAGTGPFAALLVPLLPLYADNKINIDAIDYHSESIRSLENIIEKLEIKNYFDNLIKGDAVNFDNKNAKKYDIIICECLRHGLSVEPQLAITLNISKYLSGEGVFIPQDIDIHAILGNLTVEIETASGRFRKFWYDIKRENAIKNRIDFGTIFQLNKNTFNSYRNLINNNNIIPGEIISIRNQKKGFNDLFYLTKITICDNIFLSESDESGLTKPYIEKQIPPIKRETKIQFNYQLGSDPKFIPQILD